MNKIIAVIGLCGSGKSEVVKTFEKHKFAKVYFGQITIDEVKRLGQPVTEANERAVREGFRKKYGMAAYAILNVEKIRDNFKKSNVVVESMYSWEEYKILKEEFKDQFSTLAIFTPKTLRYERLAKRPSRPLTTQESYSRDIAELEISNKGNPIAFADYTIINDGTMEELNAKIEIFIKENSSQNS